MRSRSNTWKQLVARGEFHLETVARVYGANGNDINGVSGTDFRGQYKEYATITAPVVKHGLLPDNTLSVGNCVAGTMSFTLMTTDKLPKSAKIVLRSRVTDGKTENSTKSEWLEFGTYWVDHRTYNENLIDLECYDAMKMAYQTYVDDSETLSWPKTIAVVVRRCAAQMGIGIDSRTVTDIINSSFGEMNIITKPNDNDTLLTILEDIAEILGGNWCISPDNTLRFIPLMTSPEPREGYIIDNNNEIIQTDQGDNLWYENTAISRMSDTIDVPVVIGSVTTASDNVVSRVTMTRDSNTLYTFGDDTGYEIKVENNPYVTESLCLALYERIVGITYSPYEITNAIYDPATELGDYIYVGNKVNSVMYTETRTFGIGFSADNAAPGEDELENEYPFQTMEQRVQYVSAESKQTRTMIQQTQQDVQIIAEDYTKASTVRSTFALDPTNITLTAGEDEHGDATGTITFNGGTIIVNSNNFQLDADGIMTCNGANIKGAFSNSTVDETTGFASRTLFDEGEIRFYDVDIANESETLVAKMHNWYGDTLTIEGKLILTNELNGNGGSIGISSQGVNIQTPSIYVQNKSSGEFGTGYTGTIEDANGNVFDVVCGIIVGGI